MTPANSPILLPRRIFAHYNIKAHERNLMNRVAIHAEERRYLPPPLIEKLACHPHLLARAILGGVVAFETEAAILADPYVAFLTVMQNYDVLGPRLEELYLHTNPDALFLLISNLRAYPKAFAHPEQHYLDLLAKTAPTLRIWLEPEANWQALVQGFVKEPGYANPQTPEWVYFDLSRKACERLDPKAMATLAGKEEYLYWAAGMFAGRREKGIVAPHPDEVLGMIRTPRWAFHALRDRLTNDPIVQNKLLHVVKGSAAWLVELAHLKIWDDAGQIYGGTSILGDYALEQIYVEGVKRLCADPCIDDFHCWARASLFPPKVVSLVQEFERFPTRTKAA
jgi:hypothetical protein